TEQGSLPVPLPMLKKPFTTTRGRLVAVLALIATVAFAPSAMGKKQSTADMLQSILHISKRADSNARKALGAVDSGRIKDSSVKTGDLANRAITNAKLADNSVTSSKIADGQVTGADIADGAVDGTKVAADSLGGDKIASNAIGSDELAPDSVNSSKIAG